MDYVRVREYVSEVKNAKAQLEDDLLELLKSFQEETGLFPAKIDVQGIKLLGTGAKVTKVDVDLWI